jgi:hypothetical protein
MRAIIAGVLAAAVIVYLPSLARAASDDGDWGYKHRQACPPGHRVPISIADVTLYIDLRSVTRLDLGDFPTPPDSCPTQPFKATLLYFYYGYKELKQLYEDRNLPLKLLRLEAGTAKKIWRLPFPDFTEKKRAIGTSGFVEDVSDRAHLPSLNQRAYLFQHLIEGNDEPFMMVCSGDPAGSPPRRDCDAHYFLEPGLIINYEVRQDARDDLERHWSIPPTKPIQEPDGLLEFDRKVRDLIQFFRTEPREGRLP